MRNIILILALALATTTYSAEIPVYSLNGLKSALDTASDGDEIILVPATYTLDVRIKRAFTIRSRYPGDPTCVRKTIVNGYVRTEADGAAVDGITVTGAILCDSKAIIINNRIIGEGYEGISASGGHGSVFTGNFIESRFIGIEAEVRDTIIIGNTLVSCVHAVRVSNSQLVADNYIVGNDVGVIATSFVAIPALIGNMIINNKVQALVGEQVTAIGNIICGNVSASGGGGMSATGIAMGNIIVGNVAPRGGGIYAGERLTMANNVIVGNRAEIGGGVCNAPEGATRVLLGNSIIWGNMASSGPQLALQTSWGIYGSVTVVNSLVEGGQSAVYLAPAMRLLWEDRNIDADPLFVDPGHWDDAGTPDDLSDDTFIPGDYHLLPGSPCIDAGTDDVDNPDTTTIETLPASDIAGLPRVIDGNLDGTATVDIGAYEYLPGDVNYDGKVNVLDLLLVRNSLGRDPASSIEARKADVNADGAVNVEDMITVRGRLGR